MEKSIESYFVKKVKLVLKGLPLKINSLSMNGMPDRLVLLPEGKIFFVELKDNGKKARPQQLAIHKILQKLGFTVYIIDSKEKVNEVIEEWSLGRTTIKS